jgi:hypothetical protein
MGGRSAAYNLNKGFLERYHMRAHQQEISLLLNEQLQETYKLHIA